MVSMRWRKENFLILPETEPRVAQPVATWELRLKSDERYMISAVKAASFKKSNIRCQLPFQSATITKQHRKKQQSVGT
jgi:hypothetical protein